MMTVEITQRLFTADEYERMIATGILTEDERLELIDGEIRPMSPIGSRHAACVKRLIALFTEKLGRSVIVGAQDPIRLSDDTEPQPDISVLRPRDDFYATHLPRPQDVLLVIEVADTTFDFDHDTKLPRYAAAGIAEAWLIDLSNNVIEQHTRPMNNRYGNVITLQRGDVLHATVVSLEAKTEDILG